MADFSPLLGKSGKPTGAASGDNVKLVSGVTLSLGDVKFGDGTGVASNASGASLSGYDVALLTNVIAAGISDSGVDTIAGALDMLDDAIGIAKTLNVISDAGSTQAHATIDLANNGGFPVLVQGTEVLATGTTEEELLHLKDDGGVSLFEFHIAELADTLRFRMDTNLYTIETDGTDAYIDTNARLVQTAQTDLNLTAGQGAVSGDMQLAALDGIYLDASGVFSLDGVGASNVTADSGNLTLSTTTSGSLIASSAGALDMDGTVVTLDGSTSTDINTTAGNTTLSTTTSGIINLKVADSSDNLDYIDVAPASGTTTLIRNVKDPLLAQDAATKAYADAIAAGVSPKDHVYAASDTEDFTVTQAGSGVGATLTNADTDAVFALDGTNPAAGSRVLIKGQTDASQNGIYTVTDVGSGITDWILTRATDLDGSPANECEGGDYTFVQNGTENKNTGWVITGVDSGVDIDVDTDNMTWSQFSAAGHISANNGLTQDGTNIGLLDVLETVGRAIKVTSGAIELVLNSAASSVEPTLAVVTDQLEVKFNSTTFEADATNGLELASTAVDKGLALTGGTTIDLISAATTLTITSGNVEVAYGSAANTAVEGDVTLEAIAGNGLTGGQAAAALDAGPNTSFTFDADLDSFTNEYPTNGDDDITTGKLLMFTATGADLAIATDTTNGSKIIGFAAAADDDALDTVDVYTIPGTRITGLSGMTAGAIQYMSRTVAGGLTEDPSVATGGFATGDQVVQVGFAVSATELIYMPQFMYEIS